MEQHVLAKEDLTLTVLQLQWQYSQFAVVPSVSRI